jgi:hypothetical protein
VNDVNSKSMFLTCKHVLPHMERQGKGAIVNIASVSGIRWLGVNPANARPALPENMPAALKFSACLPNSIAAAVLQARLAVPDAVAEIQSRPIRKVRGEGKPPLAVVSRDVLPSVGHTVPP